MKGISQVTAIGPYLSNSQSNDNSAGSFAFSNMNKASGSDNQYATASATAALFVANTNYLILKDFGTEVPPTATIKGIKVEIEKSASGISVLASVKDNIVKLIKGGSIAGSNRKTTTDWTTSNVTEVYGSSSDMWGLSLTPSDVNSIDFGVAFAARIAGVVSVYPTVKIDNVKVTIYYTPSSLPVSWLYFRGKQENEKTDLEWATASEKNSSFFSVEKDFGADNWKEVGKLAAAGNSVLVNNYKMKIDNPDPSSISYFRIKQVDFDGKYSYSETIKTNSSKIPESFKLTQEDQHFNIIFLSDEIKEWHFSLITSTGVIEKSIKIISVKGINTLNLENTERMKGLCFLCLSDGINTYCSKQIFY